MGLHLARKGSIFRGCGGLPRKGARAKKFGMSLETQGKKSWAGSPGIFARISRGCLKSLRKKLCSNFGPYCRAKWPTVARQAAVYLRHSKRQLEVRHLLLKLRAEKVGATGPFSGGVAGFSCDAPPNPENVVRQIAVGPLSCRAVFTRVGKEGGRGVSEAT